MHRQLFKNWRSLLRDGVSLPIFSPQTRNPPTRNKTKLFSGEEFRHLQPGTCTCNFTFLIQLFKHRVSFLYAKRTRTGGPSSPAFAFSSRGTRYAGWYPVSGGYLRKQNTPPLAHVQKQTLSLDVGQCGQLCYLHIPQDNPEYYISFFFLL